MKRVGRIIYNLATALSLLLFLATVLVWVRSYFVRDTIQRNGRSNDPHYLKNYVTESSKGGVMFYTMRYTGNTIRWYREPSFFYMRNEGREYPSLPATDGNGKALEFRRYRALGFEFVPEFRQPIGLLEDEYMAISSLTLPLYFPALLFALLPAHYFLRVRRRRRVASRRARGCCVFCGYDLRASAGRCPECGRDGAGDKDGNHGLR